MPVEAFIKFTAPAGTNMQVPSSTSIDPVLKDYAPLQEFSLSVENTATIGSATAGAGAGKVQFKEFTIRRAVDSSSSLLFKNCAAGAHYSLVTVAVRRPGDKPHLVYNFGTVFTTKIAHAGPGDEAPEETVTFAYGALSIAVAKQLADGRLDALKSAEWNQLTNTGTFTSPPPALTF